MGKAVEGLTCISPAARDSYARAGARVCAGAGVGLHLVETIVLPEAGQWTILRFGPEPGVQLSYDEADALEVGLRQAAGPGYRVALVGDAYRERPPDMARRMILIDETVPSAMVRPSGADSAAAMWADAAVVRVVLRLPAGSTVWEIEIPAAGGVGRPVIRIVAPPEGRSPALPELVRIGDTEFDIEVLPYDRSFEGCLKAYLLAERDGAALLSTIARIGCDEAA